MTTVKDSVSVPPKYVGKEIKDSVTEILRSKYERTIDKGIGLILVVFNVRDISEGYILPEDPNIHYHVTFDVLSFNAVVEEVFAGEVSELAEYGAFVRIGPMDALVHLSQITTEFVSFDRKAGVLISKASKKTLKKGDAVYAKVSTISFGNTPQSVKIAMTMRPEGLGKLEWLTEAPEKGKEKAKAKKK